MRRILSQGSGQSDPESSFIQNIVKRLLTKTWILSELPEDNPDE